jgi:hypothetical protein
MECWRRMMLVDTREHGRRQIRRLMNRLALAGLAIMFLVVTLAATLGCSQWARMARYVC